MDQGLETSAQPVIRHSLGWPRLPNPLLALGKGSFGNEDRPSTWSHVHGLQWLRPLAHILSHRAHDLSYNERRTESRHAAFHKVVLARLNVDVEVATMIRVLVHPRDSGEGVRPGSNPKCNEARRSHEGKLLVAIEYPAFACTEIVAG
jgi:hypothetical protein